MRALLLCLLLTGCPTPSDDDLDNDGVPDAEDCNPNDPDTFAGADDPYGDSRDTNCDGLDGIDADGDGYPSNVEGNLGWRDIWDCADDDPDVHPGVEDLVGDGEDRNCDGIDGEDADGDGHASLLSGGTDCDDTESAVSPDEPDFVGDGLDRNCDGIDGTDADHDGYAALSTGGTDCDDSDPSIHPDAPDPCDGIHSDCQADPAEFDDDGDGWFPCDGDCDDDDPARNPGAAELCDGEDRNCDGQPGATDGDGDGVQGCNGDCDDADAGVFPGAPEACNGRDDDCDGVLSADELDGDGDGRAPCEGDCSDQYASVHPGSWQEVPGDGTDSDCSGQDGWPSLGRPWTRLLGDSSANRFGAAVAALDYDGDGVLELAVAAPGSSITGPGAFTAGRIFLFDDPASHLDLDPADADFVLEGEGSLDFAGTTLANAGDPDGDGLDDLLVGAFGNDDGGQNAGKVYLVPGSWLSGSGTRTLGSIGWAWTGQGTDAQAGSAVAGPGDVNGDGRDDLLIGSSGATPSGAWSGATYLVSGAALGAQGTSTLASVPMRFEGESAGHFSGSAVAGGDVDGDGRADVLIGAPAADGAQAGVGRAYLFFGAGLPGSGAIGLGSADLVFEGGAANERAGSPLAVGGDVDGDGGADVLVGAPTASLVRLFRSATLPGSGTVPAASADHLFTGVDGGFDAGGDVDGDGRADVLVGSPAGDGVAWLFLSSEIGGGGTHVLDASAHRFLGAADEAAASTVLLPGDLDGDGRADLLIGSSRDPGEAPGTCSVLLSPF